MLAFPLYEEWLILRHTGVEEVEASILIFDFRLPYCSDSSSYHIKNHIAIAARLPLPLGTPHRGRGGSKVRKLHRIPGAYGGSTAQPHLKAT